MKTKTKRILAYSLIVVVAIIIVVCARISYISNEVYNSMDKPKPEMKMPRPAPDTAKDTTFDIFTHDPFFKHLFDPKSDSNFKVTQQIIVVVTDVPKIDTSKMDTVVISTDSGRTMINQGKFWDMRNEYSLFGQYVASPVLVFDMEAYKLYIAKQDCKPTDCINSIDKSVVKIKFYLNP